VQPGVQGGRNMTTDMEYRNQMRQVRQTARAQVLAIQQAWLLRDRLAAERPLQKRLRRAMRLAQMPPQVQDARLEAALEAGRIELWSPAVPMEDEVVVGEFFGPPWDPAMAEVALPPEAYFGPYLPAVDIPGEALLTLSAGMRIGWDIREAATDLQVLPVDQGMEWDRADEVDWDDGVAASVVAAYPVGDEPDLMALPGAGPGLIWMLQKCGITTLTDLAETDAAALVPKLGLVGQIVDIHGWQSFARRHVGSAPRSVTG